MTKYYGVIGNRDHIKIQGDRHPFWEFLDRQPDGFLSSLAYLPLKDFDMPETPIILDCGAWSYKDEQVPKLGKNLVTPEWVLGEYLKYGKEGDLVVAPDHMLIPDTDLEYRRQFNIESAKAFLSIARNAGFNPMATVHGMDLDERLINVGRLYEIGYRHFSLGGMAARASQKAMLLESIQAISNKVRSVLPDAWIHVLGLSSPDYFKAFNQIGIDSCDGSSHFKQAFTGGTFFSREGAKLIKHQSIRVDKETRQPLGVPDFPECSCLACSRLREEGIDTRYYGSNENNMGRAAHNLNMLMAAHKAVTAEITLVSCVGEKLKMSAPVKDIYQSAWFKKARTYVESQEWDWYVISAEHGLLERDRIIAPYEKTLNDMPADEVKAWSRKVFDQILNVLPDGGHVRIFAGKNYRKYLIPLLENAGYAIEIPLEGLGIGRQLAWFDSKFQPIQRSLF